MSFDLKLENGDLLLEKGDLKTVADSDKLIQDVLKISLTDAGSNPLHPWYGSFISRNIVGTSQDINFLITIGRSQLQSALENLKRLQEIQQASYQKMTLNEQILSVLDISLFRNVFDPRQIDVGIKILTKGRNPVETSFSITTT